MIIRGNSGLVFGSSERGTGVEIDIRNESKLYIENSILTTNPGGGGLGLDISFSDFIMKDSELHGVTGSFGGGPGINDAAVVIIENSLITSSHTGITINSA